MDLAGFRRDLRYAARVLLRNPGFASIVVLSLGLGIGANSAIFTIIDGLLFKTLPIRQPETLRQLTIVSASPSLHNFSFPAFDIVRNGDHGLSGWFAWHRTRFNVERAGAVEAVDGAYVSGAYYDSLGVGAFRGRMLDAQDERMEAGHGGPVATISHAYWRRVLGERPDAVGESLNIGGVHFTIVGVQPPEFHGLDVGASPDVILPITAERLIAGRASILGSRGAHWLKVFARRPDGVGDDAVRARLRALAPRLFEQVVPMSLSGAERDRYLAQQLDFAPAGRGISELRRRFVTPLWLLLGTVALVLLIACANIANLLLARATARQGEVAVRLALGGSRPQILRQLTIEGLLLTFIGATLAVLFSLWGTQLFLTMTAPALGRIVLDLSLDFRILAFTGAVAMAAGTLFGLAPALAMRRVDVGAILKQNAGSMGRMAGSRGSVRRGLVVSQVAISLLLLVGAALFVQSLRNLRTIDLGFSADNLLIVRTAPRERDVADGKLPAFYAELLPRVQAIPGVQLATASRFGPLEGIGFTLRARALGARDVPSTDEVHVNAVVEGFFEAVGIPIIRGRSFTARDTEGSPPVGLINAAMARQYFPNEDPLGKYIVIGTSRLRDPMEIIGVLGDVRYDGPRTAASPTMFTAWRQDPRARAEAMTILVRTTMGSTAAVGLAVRREIESAGSPVRASEMVSLRERIDRTLGQERLLAILSSSFAWLALILATVGLYGVTAYATARRTAEIGLRLALGAQRRDIVWLVLRETFLLVLLGIALGVPAAMAASRSISSLLFETGAQTQVTLGVATAIMVVVAAIGACVPAYGAARVDPISALRTD